jgi:peroxiredoxin Q/BCP
MSQALQPGTSAPDFALPDQHGEMVKLSALRGRPVVLFFYPKDASPGCTAEACGFRDAHAAFVEAGAAVLGVSRDSVASHARFAAKHSLPYRLLSDVDGKVHQLYGVGKTLGILPARVTFVIDSQGIIRHRFASQLFVGRHVKEALELVEALASRANPSTPAKAAQ